MFRHNHIEAHQLLVFLFARIKTDDIVARQLPYCEAVQREAGPVVRLRGDHTDGVAVWEHAGLGAVDGYMLYLCEGTEAHIEDVVCKLLEAAKRVWGILDGHEDTLRQ